MPSSKINATVNGITSTGGNTASLELQVGGVTGVVVGDQSLTVPIGTTAQRPATPATGMVRFNTTTSTLEQYDGSSWVSVGGGAVAPSAVSDQTNTSTGYFDLPAGTTAQRPASPAAGMVRYNTTTGEPEWYDPAGSGQWLGFYKGPNYAIEYLVVAGGAGGGGYTGGGGGAGGLISASTTVFSTVTYTVTIGAAGSGGSGSSRGTSGSNSVFDTSTAIGGGAGAPNDVPGLSGGSGGGGGHAPGGTGGAGTAGQGYAGGSGSGAPLYGGGGGGGATAVGQTGQGGGTGNGGAGSNWLGLGTYYAGGGGGGIYNSGGTPGQGGVGGGGNGGNSSLAPQNSSANTGGGGGGCGNNGPLGGNGGSGIVIVRYSGSQRGTGGTVTQSGGYTYHTFTSSGTYIA